MEKNKVKFNLRKVYYAMHETSGNTISFCKPVSIPGAVALAMDPQGDVTPFYADGMTYYNATANNGYAGDLEMASFPAQFLKDVYGYKEDPKTKVILENAHVEPKPFALLFAEDGDKSSTLFVMYNCSATRPKHDFKTTAEKKEPITQSISIKATGLENGNVVAMTQEDTPQDVLDKWYEAVFVPTFETVENQAANQVENPTKEVK